ncbi:hypothetical protein [Planctomycetes bacterium TBK1r]|uniref:Planctomycete extracellular n=1 Tax=Stieleria magnilauensis TaxID=2527963 RepID=A0ABX5XKX1_9BACT|nr:Planctomycete extracellular [Planctomycetes bacterium TBK1r]
MKCQTWGHRHSGRRRLRIETLEKRHLLAAALLETSLLRDLNPQPPASGAQQFVAVGDRLFFVADDGLHGDELFVINGEGQGVLVKDIGPGPIDGEIQDEETPLDELLTRLAQDFQQAALDGPPIE